MSMGDARALHRHTKQPVMIAGRDGRPIRSDLMAGVPYLITKPTDQPYQRLVNGPGIRPYIASKTERKWTWRPYKPQPAEIVFTPAELAFAEPYRDMVMLEPHVKSIGHRNKDWGPINWQQLDTLIREQRLGRVVQCGPQGTRFLHHATPAVTSTFRHALAVLSVCRAFVGTEGGLMHGAAAVGTPAVILWSEFISPEITGYAQHRNIRHAGVSCGSRVDCEGCNRSMTAILPAEVAANLKEILHETDQGLVVS